MRAWLVAASILVVGLTAGTAASAQNYPPTTTTTTTTTSTTTTTLPGATTTTSSTTTTVPGEERPSVRSFGAIRPGESFNKLDCGFRPGATAEIRFNGNAAGTATVRADGCVQLRVDVVTASQVRIDGRTYTTVCGPQTIDVIAPAPSGARRTAVNRFTIPCDAAPGSRGAGLTRTGADAIRWGVVALGLIAIGVAFVLADRRRANRRTENLVS